MTDSLVVQTQYGPVKGLLRNQVESWRGVRYAAAPTGALRFRAPQPPMPWTEPADATEYGPVAPQRPVPAFGISADVPQDEDCLTLNVYRPKRESAGDQSPLPVMVWIHGGAYAVGGSRQPAFDGTALANAQNVMLVTLNYRLGAFGYLDLGAWSTPDEPFDRNLALRDQLAALEWVRDNIAAFGGDPKNVTLFGQSAGGGAVTTLMTMPRAKGLFARAIAQSSPVTSMYKANRTHNIALRFFELAGLNPEQPADLAKLRSMSTADLLAASQALYDDIPLSSPGTLAYAPIVDEDLVPDYPIEVFRRGEQHRIPLMIGNARDEATLFKFMKSPIVPIELEPLEGLFAEAGVDHPDLTLPTKQQLLSAYDGKTNLKARLHIAGDFGFRMPSLWLAVAHAQVAPTWLYRYDWSPLMMRLLGIGATHASELGPEFGNIVTQGLTFKLGGLKVTKRLSADLMQHWTDFAKTGTPGADWPGYSEPERLTKVFDAHDRVVSDLDAPLWKAWGSDPIYLN